MDPLGCLFMIASPLSKHSSAHYMWWAQAWEYNKCFAIASTPLNAIDIQHFAIQYWAETKDIIMQHIAGVLSIPDDLAKALGWILHLRHAWRMMSHFIAPNPCGAFMVCWGRTLLVTYQYLSIYSIPTRYHPCGCFYFYNPMCCLYLSSSFCCPIPNTLVLGECVDHSLFTT